MSSPDGDAKDEPLSPTDDVPMGRIARAKALAEEAKLAGAERLDQEQERRAWVRVALTAYSRDRSFAGGLLAGGLAFKFFLWLLPFSLVVASALKGFSDSLQKPPSEVARDAGLSAAMAGSVSTAAEASGRSWVYLLLVGLVLVMWAGSSVLRAVRLVSGLAWEVDRDRGGNPLVEAAVLVAAALAAIICHQVLSLLGDGSFMSEFSLLLVESALLTGLLVWMFWHLPHAADAGWTAMVPGALLGTVGFALTRIATIVYFAPKLDRVDDLYGALGLASVYLAWLYIIGRLVVGGVSLNASTHRAKSLESDHPDATVSHVAPDRHPGEERPQ